MSQDNEQVIASGMNGPEVFVHNLAKLYEEYGRAVAAFVEPREQGIAPIQSPTDSAEVAATLTKIAESWLADPQKAVVLQTQLWTGYMNVWSGAFRRSMGEQATETATPLAGDKRFASPDWTKNLFFDFCKQFYLVTTKWAEEAVENATNIDDHTRDKARFYVRQISAALSPSNFVMTNPDLLKETLETNGENLVRGMAMLTEDIRKGQGDVKLRQTDENEFQLGKNIATTPGVVIFENDLIQLIQYEATTPEVSATPMLVVPPWINKYYILDLNSEKSFIKWMLDQKQTVFCISWVNPDEKLKDKSFEDYMQEGVLAALSVVQDITGAPEVNTMGYCVGGTLLAATLAYLSETGAGNRIANATLLAAQVDFSEAGDLKVFIDEPQIEALEIQMEKTGYLDAKHMASTFNMLRANDLIWPYFVNTYLRGQQPGAFDLLYWNADSTRMTPANHSFYLRQCYLQNSLAKGKMALSGVTLDLKTVTCPVYLLATREDHIAPAKSVYNGRSCFGGSVTFTLSASGHIAGVINPPAKHKYSYWTAPVSAPSLSQWQNEAAQHDGSWWPHWLGWMEKNKTLRAAPAIGSGQYAAIEPAPGRYAKLRS